MGAVASIGVSNKYKCRIGISIDTTKDIKLWVLGMVVGVINKLCEIWCQ
jgi:hypothetical protein